MQDITDNSDVEKVLVHYFIFLDYLKLIHFMSITVPMLTRFVTFLIQYIIIVVLLSVLRNSSTLCDILCHG